MSKITVAAKKLGGFMKRNAFYFMIVLCIASVATVIALAVTGNFNSKDPGSVVIKPDDNPGEDPGTDDPGKQDPDDPVVKPDPISFGAPSNGTVSKEYADETLVWNDTLGQYEVHMGIDFTGDDLSVLAAEKGTVTDVGYDDLDGYYVIVSHNENYQTKYYSLDENISVKKGDTVTKGQLLGTMGTSRSSESLAGKHLHFEMTKDGKDINPLDVLILEEK